MKRWQEWLILILILGVAAALRLTGLDWDAYQHFHPDERYITWVATTIERPSSLTTALDPRQSPFNPFYWPPAAASEGIVVLQDEPRDFAYGHVPLYLGVMATRLLERVGPVLDERLPAEWLLTRDLLNGAGWIEFRHLTAVARALTALFDVGTVFLVYVLGKRLYRAKVGLLAAAFLAVNVMHVQLSHFFISDPFLTFFVVAAIVCMVSLHQAQRAADPRWPWAGGAAAVFVGLAVGSKFAAVMLFLPLGVTLYLAAGEKWVRALVTAAGVAFVTFLITNPFALIDLSCEVWTPGVRYGPLTVPALNWRSCYLENIITQGAMVRGSLDAAFTRQYIGTWPYLYFIEMQLRWGMGLLLGVTAFAGFAWGLWQAVKPIGRWWRQAARKPVTQLASSLQTAQSDYSLYIVLAWAIPFFLTTGSFQVKFMRYLQPVVPFFMIFGAALLLSIRRLWLRRVTVTAVLLFSTVYALGFVHMYTQPHPWWQGSRWVYDHVPPGTLILSEQWDDSLPMSMVVDGEVRYRSEYPNEELTWLVGADENDTVEKLENNLDRLAAADYLTVMSARIYGVVPRLAARYPLSSQYHQLLFAGELGYEPVFVTTRTPNLWGLAWQHDTFDWPGLVPPDEVTAVLSDQPALTLGRADESFSVYDQPLLMIFENKGHLSAAEMIERFNLQP